MTIWIAALIGIGISAGIIFIGLIFIRRLSTGGSSEEKALLVSKIEHLNSAIQESLRLTEGHYSSGQLDSVISQLRDIQLSLEAQKKSLKEVENKLEEAQKIIEEKEGYHQSLKSSRAEDEEKMMGLLARFDDISAESISLEQRLAVSMKNLDQMMGELQLSEDQIVMFQEIQNALTEGSSQLRELFIEYDGIKKRIDTLNSQLEDLEGEYTKLVEQQLGD